MKNFRFIFLILLLFGLSTPLIGNEWANYYFPDTYGSYWVYEDQNGDELTRYAIKPQEIEGEDYKAFSYDPPLEDWTTFEHYIRPYFYQVSEDWVAFFVGTEIEHSVKASTTQQVEETIVLMRQMMTEQLPEGLNISFDIGYDIEVNSQEYFYLLPTPAPFNEEWTALEVNVGMTMTVNLEGLAPGLPGSPAQTVRTNTHLVETGSVIDTETVETEAGTFEDCLVIEYRTDAFTETTASVEIPGQAGSVEQEDITVATVWLAPNVGIVKFEHKHQVPPTVEEFDLPVPEDQTFELIRYEVKSASSEDE